MASEKLEKRVDELEKELESLKVDNKELNRKLVQQAGLVLSIGKKLLKLNGKLKEDSYFNCRDDFASFLPTRLKST